ncbi:hypothetical protein L1987_66283 [Smallanthus sonchifolius]|uniref:Uncharacterized protein n=1 Tax=Smallanthus sonchifolius TaxID=185202 RepID=A0ACB9BWQ1_9ASTR|nr:hypothetical protein L1987_66283 [Smallanthus sonchifolius]
MGSREKDIDLKRLIPLKGLGLPETNGDSKSSSPADSPQGAPSSARHTGKERFCHTSVMNFIFEELLVKRKRINSMLHKAQGLRVLFFLLVFVKVIHSWASKKFMSGWFVLSSPPTLHLTKSSHIFAGYIYGQGSNAFKEVAIIKHPNAGEYAFGFITSTLVLRKSSEIVISGGMSIPKILTMTNPPNLFPPRDGKYVIPEV